MLPKLKLSGNIIILIPPVTPHDPKEMKRVKKRNYEHRVKIMTFPVHYSSGKIDV